MATLLNIVVVEDHEALLEALVDMLRQEGHHVAGLTCAEAIDDEGAHQPIDLLIVDLGLPGEDGMSLARRFRAAQPQAFVIMLTARNRLKDKVEGYNSGADVYLTKPVERAELAALVQAVARRTEARRRIDLEPASGALTLHTASLLLSGPGGETRVSRSEMLILCALARAPGQMLETWQIMEVLGEGPETYPKSGVELRFSRLRAKMAKAGAGPASLQAVRSSGYQICVSLQVL